MNKDKIQAVVEWPRPTSVKEIQSFLGLASYYRRFVKGFAKITAPLTDLLQKDHVFVWEARDQRAFEEIKKAMTSAPVLVMPDPNKPFVITTDASQFAIGAVLAQDVNDGLHPIAYLSRKLSKSELNYPVHEKELLSL